MAGDAEVAQGKQCHNAIVFIIFLYRSVVENSVP